MFSPFKGEAPLFNVCLFCISYDEVLDKAHATSGFILHKSDQSVHNSWFQILDISEILSFNFLWCSVTNSSESCYMLYWINYTTYTCVLILPLIKRLVGMKASIQGAFID